MLSIFVYRSTKRKTKLVSVHIENWNFSSSPELLLLNKAFRIAFVESLREKSGKSMRGNVSQQTWTNISIVYFSQMGATEQDVKRASQAESYVKLT